MRPSFWRAGHTAIPSAVADRRTVSEIMAVCTVFLQAAMAERHRVGRSSSGDLGAVQQPRTPGSPSPQG